MPDSVLEWCTLRNYPNDPNRRIKRCNMLEGGSFRRDSYHFHNLFHRGVEKGNSVKVKL